MGFIKSMEWSEGRSYSIEYSSDCFVFKIDQYYREFYLSLYKPGKSGGTVDLYNLIDYLFQGSSVVVESKYFSEEETLNECYKKQFKYLADTVYSYYSAICDFFSAVDFESKMKDIDRFMINKYPNLFKTI